jgi:hypothetical protein
MATYLKHSRKNPSSMLLSVNPRLRVALGLMLVAAGGAVGVHSVRASRLPALGAAHRPRTFDGAAGPWGKLHYKRIWIEPPPDVLAADRDRGAPRWFFGGFSAERLTDLFSSLGLDAPTFAAFTDQRRWRASPSGIWVLPPVEAAAALAPATRARLYEALAPFPENRQHAPIPLQADLIDEQLEAGRLPGDSAALIRRLLYPRDKWLLFADEFLALSVLHDHRQRTQVLETLVANPTYLVTLDLDAATDVEALGRYWSLGTRPDDRASLLRAAADLPGGSTIPMGDLLPPFARRLLYTYPNRAVDPALDRRNCFWTALNFFSDVADDSLADLGPATTRMHEAYTPVTSPSFGDLVVLIDPSGTPMHAAVYLADDLVFTKNGGGQFHPWIYMKTPDLLDRYNLLAQPSGSVKPIYLRRRAEAGPPPLQP